MKPPKRAKGPVDKSARTERMDSLYERTPLQGIDARASSDEGDVQTPREGVDARPGADEPSPRSSAPVGETSQSSVLSAEELIRAAKIAREHAYAPYSRFKVGAAVLTDAGLYTGVNVENASYPLSVCAERNAIAAAVGAGARRVYAIAVIADTPDPVSPCGGCRQVIREFGPHAKVHLANVRGKMRSTTADALLPGAFGPEDLGVPTVP